MPATAKLLATIAKLPHGAVVLPGLDTELDDASWALIAGNKDDDSHDGLPAAGHAQFAMHALLDRIGIARADVGAARAGTHGREALVSEALRPAATTEHWQERLADKDFAAAADARARKPVADRGRQLPRRRRSPSRSRLREALETQDKTAALVTPDRALARRVAGGARRAGM